MTLNLTALWNDRVVGTRAEISLVDDKIASILEKKKQLKEEIGRYNKIVEREKGEMLSYLEKVEAEAKRVEEETAKFESHRAQVKKEFNETLDNYENMRQVIKNIQRDEEALSKRYDLAKLFERESSEWADQERALRAEVETLEEELNNMRKAHMREIVQLEAEKTEAEDRLQQTRAQRQEELRQLTQAPLQNQRRSLSFAGNRVEQFEMTKIPKANRKEQQFIAMNASTGVPTRQLRSCLRNGNNNSNGAGANPNHNDMGSARDVTDSQRYNCNGGKPPQQPVSAPVSRAVSQSLVGGVEGSCDQPPVASGRACSHAEMKKVAGRKRGLLKDYTNY
ncbi:unnamed protein product [Trypanosoma congolense IL3000]|uniref:WGS project CAEQ00000000 data, annotated contig 1241 n=1 Tax=Trypanosoma congolense (strain IL3000) TaxID=1068625 RepID=F9W4W0_TRYCI|nr:unnamed protein product [Trypanosoma congolense IL3000]